MILKLIYVHARRPEHRVLGAGRREKEIVCCTKHVRNELSAHDGAVCESVLAVRKNATPALRNMYLRLSMVPSVTAVTSIVRDVVDGGEPVSRARQ